jgi:photosystem II stability/assembly factor-like uncharacterized protein
MRSSRVNFALHVEDALMTHPRRIAIASFAVTIAFGALLVGQPSNDLVHEDPNVALRRAQAFHDMYAAPPDKTALNAQAARFGATPAAARVARPLPINYSTFDPAFRLKPLRRDGDVRPGMVPGPGARGAATGAAPVWTNIGPANFAGRVSALAIHPTNPQIIYRGTAGGGVWMTKDGGGTWQPLTDGLGNLSVGAIALAPGAAGSPPVIYVGTGEGALGIDGINGIGFIKSLDDGATWTLPVAVPGRRFFALNVHPARPAEILAATLAGVQKSVDGGATWTPTSLNTLAATDIVRMPGAPDHLLATSWDIASSNATWTGSIFRSENGGNTWTKVGSPGAAPFGNDTGRLSLAVSAAAPARVYALAASASGNSNGCPQDPVDQTGVYTSTNEGQTWALTSNPVSGACRSFQSILGGQGWYANVIRVDRANASTVYAGGLNLWKSTDAGTTWIRLSRWDLAPTDAKFVHADIHAIAWAGSALLVGNDGGVNKTTNGGSSFTGMNTGIVTRQYYNIAVSPADRALIIGGAQDNGTNIRVGSTATYREVIGGDGFGVAVHPSDPKKLYGTVYDARVFRSTNGGVSFSEVTPNYGANEKRPFISPLTMDLRNPDTLYTGTNFLYRTTNGGTTWSKVSNTDLSDGQAGGYLTSIAVAPSNSQRLLTATGAGIVKKSNDFGASWTRLQGGLPAQAYPSHVEFDPVNPETFYVSFTNAGAVPRVMRTTNGGATFTRIDNALPAFPVHTVRVQPNDANRLYAGTDVGLYISTNGGTTWTPAGNGLPAVSIWDVAMFADGSLARVATHGRGFYELLLAAGPGR